jgi:recombination protein U
MGSTNYFENEVRLSLASLAKPSKDSYSEFAFHRIFDTTSFRGISEKMFCLKNPCDFIAMYSGKFYMLEAKSSHNPTSYSFGYIKPHQITMMMDWEKAGSICYFLINDRSNKQDIKCYAVTVSDMHNLILEYTKDDRKSVKWTEIENDRRFYKVERLSNKFGACWNLAPIMFIEPKSFQERLLVQSSQSL